MDEGHASVVDSKRECRTRMRHCAQSIPPPSKSILVMHQIVFKLLEMTLTFSRGHVNYRVPEGKKQTKSLATMIIRHIYSSEKNYSRKFDLDL